MGGVADVHRALSAGAAVGVAVHWRGLRGDDPVLHAVGGDRFRLGDRRRAGLVHHGLQVKADGEHRRGVDGSDAVPVQSLRLPHGPVVFYRADGRWDTVGLLGAGPIAGALSGVFDCLDLGAGVAVVHVSGDARGGSPKKRMMLHGVLDRL